MKCPLCEGSIVNGRCSFCGMPYRSDATLYHANERPSEHYKHASAKSRAIMRRQHESAGPPTLGKNATKTDIQKYQEQVRQEAVKRMTATKNPGPGADGKTKQRRPWFKSQETAQTFTEKTGRGSLPSGRKKKRAGNIVLIIFIILILLGYILPAILDAVMEYRYQNTYTDIYTDTDSLEEYDYDPYFYEGSSDGAIYYMLAAGKDAAVVGDEIDPGAYEIWTAEDSITLLLKTDNQTRNYKLESGSAHLYLTLEDGDSLSLTNAEDADSCIYLDQYTPGSTALSQPHDRNFM